jgi:hypothetical protein
MAPLKRLAGLTLAASLLSSPSAQASSARVDSGKPPNLGNTMRYEADSVRAGVNRALEMREFAKGFIDKNKENPDRVISAEEVSKLGEFIQYALDPDSYYPPSYCDFQRSIDSFTKPTPKTDDEPRSKELAVYGECEVVDPFDQEMVNRRARRAREYLVAELLPNVIASIGRRGIRDVVLCEVRIEMTNPKVADVIEARVTACVEGECPNFE